MGYGLWAMGYGLWAMGYELCALWHLPGLRAVVLTNRMGGWHFRRDTWHVPGGDGSPAGSGL